MPKYEVNIFDTKQLDQLAKSIEEYKDSLNRKCRIFTKRLAELGIPIIERQMSKANFNVDENGVYSGANTTHNTYIKLNSFQDYSEATIVLEGKEVLFIEFGSGIYYNGSVGQSPNEYGKKLGYVIGSYGKGNGKRKIWGYYADTGELILTHGVEATMPMFNAYKEILGKVYEIAKEVFGNVGI